ncbi:MAG: hypothetical protein HOE14_19070 [Gemmatimonadales bacterium]|nr:hypothetical protein [Gemmatimonadales bacterium]
MFEIPKGAEVLVFKAGLLPKTPADHRSGVEHWTRESKIYEKYQVVFDAAGSLGEGRYPLSNAHYGFRIDHPGNDWDGGTVIVSAGCLKYDGEWVKQEADGNCICRTCGFTKCADGCCCGC